MFRSVFHATDLAGSCPLGTSQRMAAYSAYCMYAIRSCRPRARNVIVIRTSNLHGRVSMDSRLNRSATNRGSPAAARPAAMHCGRPPWRINLALSFQLCAHPFGHESLVIVETYATDIQSLWLGCVTSNRPARFHRKPKLPFARLRRYLANDDTLRDN